MYKGTESGTVALGFDDEELRCAARLVSGAMGDFCPAPEDEDYEFSPGFHAKMAALIKKQRIRESAASALKGVASTAAVLVLCVSLWLGTDVEARADFKQWILTQYENSFVRSFFDGDSARSVKGVEFGWLPEGCEEAESEVNEDSGYYLFYADDGRGFVLSYTTMTSDTFTAVLTGNVKHEVVEVNGSPADYFDDLDSDGSDILWWTNEEAGIAFDLNAVLEKEEMIKIAENIKLILE